MSLFCPTFLAIEDGLTHLNSDFCEEKNGQEFLMFPKEQSLDRLDSSALHCDISRTTSEITLVLKGMFAPFSKIRRICALCLNEITFKTSRKGARIFARIFFESSREQRTKFVHFALITFVL